MHPEFLLSGDRAVTIKFKDEISLEVNSKVRMLQYKLMDDPIEGIIETIPTYSSLMVQYQPQVIRYNELKKQLTNRINNMDTIEMPKAVVTEIPVLYGGDLGPDLELCARLENKTAKQIIEIHSAHEYYVYMLGFAPGHPYMARFEEPFDFKRRDTPRVRVLAGSVVAAMNLSNILPFDQPCGWNIIGTTPVKLCDYEKELPFLLQAGQWVKYVPVTEQEYKQIKQQVQAGSYVCKTYEKVVC